ncbi:MAG TPA: hypothetical protein VMN78_13235 [Longimicrobiales bacterium]|nr:hypothetical protein [Longimicrobiales bacterium]
MSERDTPYELVFRRGRIDFEGDRFPAVRAEAEQRGVPLDDPERFVMLGSVGALMRDMVLDEAAADDAGEVWQALPPEAVAQTGALLYHAFRFSEAGACVHAIEEEAARELAAAPALEETARAPRADAVAGTAAIAAPAEAGYVQLPRNLFWARAGEAGVAEPLDGFFWALGRRFDVLLALGVRARRPGFTVIPMGVELDAPGAPASWADVKAREEGDDFANILPGGDLDRLLGITSAGEALRLAALCLRHLHASR